MILRHDWTRRRDFRIVAAIILKGFQIDWIHFFGWFLDCGVQLAIHVMIEDVTGAGRAVQFGDWNAIFVFAEMRVDHVLLVTHRFFAAHEFTHVQG